MTFLRACPAQLTPYTLKVCRVLTTHAEKAESVVTIYDLLQMFNASYLRGLMLHLTRRGKKSFVVQSDDMANRGYWKIFFYVRIEHLVVNPEGFPEV